MTASALGLDLYQAISNLGAIIVTSPLVLETTPSPRQSPEFKKLPRAVVELVLDQGQAEPFLITLMDQIIATTSNPALIFRGETLLTKILAEFCQSTFHLLIKTLFEATILKIMSRKRKPAELEKYAELILQKLLAEVAHLPSALMTFCYLVNVRAPPPHRRVAISNLIFLRCISPVLLDISLAHITAKYPRNLSQVVKLIQSLANKAASPSSEAESSKFVERNLKAMETFLDSFSRIPISYGFSRTPMPSSTIDWWMEWLGATESTVTTYFERQGPLPSRWQLLRELIHPIQEIKLISPHLYAKIIQYYWIEHNSQRGSISMMLPPGLNLIAPDSILSASPETQKRFLLRGTSDPILSSPRSSRRTSAQASISESVGVGSSSEFSLKHCQFQTNPE